MTEPAGKVVEQHGLWFEEFQIGTTYLHRPGRTVTEADNVLFTTLTMKHPVAAPKRGMGVAAARVWR